MLTLLRKSKLKKIDWLTQAVTKNIGLDKAKNFRQVFNSDKQQ